MLGKFSHCHIVIHEWLTDLPCLLFGALLGMSVRKIPHVTIVGCLRHPGSRSCLEVGSSSERAVNAYVQSTYEAARHLELQGKAAACCSQSNLDLLAQIALMEAEVYLVDLDIIG